MTAFLDASAVVKLYADEPGADIVRGLGGGTVSAITRVEVASALWRKYRAGDIDASAAATLVQQFEVDWHGSADEPSRFAVVAAAPAVLSAAALLVRRHPLRAYDAVQLASALAARDVASCADFLSFDVRLADVAVLEGLRVLG